jgi:hypothetical protein
MVVGDVALMTAGTTMSMMVVGAVSTLMPMSMSVVDEVMACSNSPLGTPRGRYHEHSSKSSLSCETKV